MTTILIAVAFVFGLIAGFFSCAMITFSRADRLQRILALFAHTGNWRFVFTASNRQEIAWNGPTTEPWKLAREALR